MPVPNKKWPYTYLLRSNDPELGEKMKQAAALEGSDLDIKAWILKTLYSRMEELNHIEENPPFALPSLTYRGEE